MGFFQKLGEAMDHRNEKFKWIRTRLEARLNVYFYLLITKRGYQGRLEFDSDEETLDMHVSIPSLGRDVCRYLY